MCFFRHKIRNIAPQGTGGQPRPNRGQCKGLTESKELPCAQTRPNPVHHRSNRNRPDRVPFGNPVLFAKQHYQPLLKLPGPSASLFHMVENPQQRQNRRFWQPSQLRHRPATSTAHRSSFCPTERGLPIIKSDVTKRLFRNLRERVQQGPPGVTLLQACFPLPVSTPTLKKAPAQTLGSSET